MDRRTRTLFVVGLAIVLAAGASFGVYRAIQRMPVREVAIPHTFVVVASESIPVGTMVTKEQVRLTGWPDDSPVAGGFTKLEDVVGRGVTSSIVQNEPITDSKLASREAGAGLPPTIPSGMRAVSVRVNDVIGVAGFTTPGTRVDVIVTVKSSDRESVSRAVVTNVQVLAAGTKTEQQKSKDGQAMPTAVVTLLVTPQDAERLALAASEGSIVLSLRNPLDIAPVGTTGARLAGLLGTPDAKPVQKVVQGLPRMVLPPPPPTAAPKPYTVDAIRGTKRTEETIK